MTARQRRHLHLTLLGVWVVVGLPLSWFLRESVPWLVFLSVYAIIVGHWSAYSAETPVEQEDDNDSS